MGVAASWTAHVRPRGARVDRPSSGRRTRRRRPLRAKCAHVAWSARGRSRRVYPGRARDTCCGCDLWAGRIVVALLFFAIVIASAIRPSVEALKRRRVPRGVGVLLHYAVLLGLAALVLWLVIPAAIDQVQSCIGRRATGSERRLRARLAIKHDILVALDRRLNDLPSGTELSIRRCSTDERRSRCSSGRSSSLPQLPTG